VIPSLLFSIPFYPMSGFQTAPQLVATFFGVLAVFSAAVGALSMAVTVMFGSAGRASLVMNLVVLVSLLFAGLLVNVGALAPWVAWVPYLSTVYYGFQALVVNEFTGLNLTISVRRPRAGRPRPRCAAARPRRGAARGGRVS
jgi:ABC-type multidrug transport system permease subunit